MTSQITQVRRKLQNLPHEFYWNIAPEVGKFFCSIVLLQGYAAVLEVGCSNGYSALWFAEALKQTGGNLFTVESNKQRQHQASRHFQQAGVDNIVTLIKGHAPEIINEHPEITDLDLAFFDATKSEYPSCLKTIIPRLKPTGIIIADNIKSHWQINQDFIQAAKSLENYKVLYSEDFGTGMIAICPKAIISDIQPILSEQSQTEWQLLT